MGGWIIRTREYGDWYMGKWEDNATQQADWGEWVKGVELGRKWKPYDWAPLCYPQWSTDPVDRTKLTYTLGAADVTYADAYRKIFLDWEMKAAALGAGWRGFPVGLSDQEGYALLMEYLRRRKAKRAADKAPPEGLGRATTDALTLDARPQTMRLALRREPL